MATAKKEEEVKKVTKATPADAVAKVEAVKKAEAAKKTAATAKKEDAPKATATKTTVAKTTAAKTTAAKKPAAVKTSEKIFIEFAGGQIEMADVVDKVKADLGNKAVKELNIYYQPETCMVYYTADGETGSCRL
ncbi:MAG: DUF6465 family protein [Coprococcus sp.]